MFWNTLKTELTRAFRPLSMVLVAALIALFWMVSDWEMMKILIQQGYTETLGSVEILWIYLEAGAFKCVMVFMLAGLYTNSFCKDDNSEYLRMILTRTDITIYTQCRFIANFCVIVVTSIMALYLYVWIMSLWVPLVPANGVVQNGNYTDIATNYPLLYVGMVGLVLGLVSAACSSVGLLYSSYKTNSFVSITISGVVFYVGASYIPSGFPFNLNGIVSMSPVLHGEMPEILSFSWYIIYTVIIIGVCGLLFWRRMKWRVENGYI